MTTTVGVLALQGDFAEHIAILKGLGVEAVEVRLPEQLTDLDGLIIPGGESTTISRLMHRWGLLEPVRGRASAGMAVWGTCAGAILLAERSSDLDREGLRLMDIDVERNAFGRQVDSFEVMLTTPVLGPEPFHAVFIRAPLISRVGPMVEVLARLVDGTVVAAQQGKLLATAFHPELTDDTRFHEHFLNLVANERSAASPARTAAGPTS
jgi:5'-phosphate synthase pdxT subunit